MGGSTEFRIWADERELSTPTCFKSQALPPAPPPACISRATIGSLTRVPHGNPRHQAHLRRLIGHSRVLLPLADILLPPPASLPTKRQHGVPGIRHQTTTPRTEDRAPNTKCQTPNAKSQMPNPKHQTPNPGHRISCTDHRLRNLLRHTPCATIAQTVPPCPESLSRPPSPPISPPHHPSLGTLPPIHRIHILRLRLPICLPLLSSLSSLAMRFSPLGCS
jgi:hypothetical protein